MKKFISIGVVSIILIGGFVFMQHKHNENCKWIAPLKTNYVLCDDGKVREK